MTEEDNDWNKSTRTGNSFPWGGILAGVGRMVFYLFLLMCSLVVLGMLLAAVLGLADTEPIGDYF
jgi:hypothetical protein